MVRSAGCVKRLFSMFVAFALVLTSMSSSFASKAYAEEGGISYEYDGKGTLRVTGEGNITSEGVNSYIEDNDIDKLLIHHLILGNDVNSIEAYSFDGFDNLYRVTADTKNASLKYIKNHAFQNCSNLSILYLPENLEYIGGKAFAISRSGSDPVFLNFIFYGGGADDFASKFNNVQDFEFPDIEFTYNYTMTDADWLGGAIVTLNGSGRIAIDGADVQTNNANERSTTWLSCQSSDGGDFALSAYEDPNDRVPAEDVIEDEDTVRLQDDSTNTTRKILRFSIDNTDVKKVEIDSTDDPYLEISRSDGFYLKDGEDYEQRYTLEDGQNINDYLFNIILASNSYRYARKFYWSKGDGSYTWAQPVAWNDIYTFKTEVRDGDTAVIDWETGKVGSPSYKSKFLVEPESGKYISSISIRNESRDVGVDAGNLAERMDVNIYSDIPTVIDVKDLLGAAGNDFMNACYGGDGSSLSSGDTLTVTFGFSDYTHEITYSPEVNDGNTILDPIPSNVLNILPNSYRSSVNDQDVDLSEFEDAMSGLYPGHKFLGWRLEASNSPEKAGVTVEANTTRAILIKAVYEPISYVVSYDLADSGVETDHYVFGSSESGYRVKTYDLNFEGSYGTGVYSINDLDETIAGDEYLSNEYIASNADADNTIVLHALTEARSFKITFNDIDGNKISENDYEYGTAFSGITVPANVDNYLPDHTQEYHWVSPQYENVEFTSSLVGNSDVSYTVTKNATFQLAVSSYPTHNARFYLDESKTAVYETVAVYEDETVSQAISELPDAKKEKLDTPTMDHYIFKGWNPEVNARISADKDFVAMWEPAEYDFNVSVSGHGSVDQATSRFSFTGQRQIVNITPDSGYRIASVVLDGNDITNDTSYKKSDTKYDIGVISDETSLVVRFEPIAYRINVTLSPLAGGTAVRTDSDDNIINHKDATDGNTAMYRVTPNDGYEISAVYINGVAVTGVNPVVANNIKISGATKDVALKAVFARRKIIITAKAGEGGQISPSGAYKYAYGGSATYTITPDSGYKIASMTVNNASVEPATTYTFDPIVSDQVLRVEFAREVHNVTASYVSSQGQVKDNTGNIIGATATVVQHGANKTYTISAADGYEIKNVWLNDVSLGAITSYSANDISEDLNFRVTFKQQTYSVTPVIGEGGSITPSYTKSYTANTSSTYTVAPDSGYVIASVKVDGAEQSITDDNSFSYTFRGIKTGNHTIQATFEEIQTQTGSGPFTLNSSAWNLENAYLTFSDDSGYYIPKARYDEVWGENSSYYRLALSNGTYASWGGNCAGLAATAILMHTGNLMYAKYANQGQLTPNSYYDSLKRMSGYPDGQGYYTALNENSDIKRLIEDYQLYINNISKTTETRAIYNNFWVYDSATNTQKLKSGGSYVSTALREMQTAYDNNEPLLLSVFGQVNSGMFGHSIVTRTDKAPENMGNGWYRVYVYDPNYPHMDEKAMRESGSSYQYRGFAFSKYLMNLRSEDKYIELNPSANLWRYYTGVNSTADQGYLGTDASGNVEYISLVSGATTAKYADYFYLEHPDKFAKGDFADAPVSGTGYLASAGVAYAIVEPESNYEIYKDNILVAKVDNGVPTTNMGTMIYIPKVESSVDDGAASSGGVLVFPEDRYTISLASGNMQLVGDDNMITASSTASTTLNVDVSKNKLEVSADEGGTIEMACSTIYTSEDYATVKVSGEAAAGDSAVIGLTADGQVTQKLDSNTLVIKAESSSSLSDGVIRPPVKIQNVYVHSGANGSVTQYGNNAVISGEDFAISIVPDAGYETSYVLVDDEIVARGVQEYLLKDVRSDMTIYVAFKPIGSDGSSDIGIPVTERITGIDGHTYELNYTKAVKYNGKAHVVSGTASSDSQSPDINLYVKRDGQEIAVDVQYMNNVSAGTGQMIIIPTGTATDAERAELKNHPVYFEIVPKPLSDMDVYMYVTRNDSSYTITKVEGVENGTTTNLVIGTDVKCSVTRDGDIAVDGYRNYKGSIRVKIPN